MGNIRPVPRDSTSGVACATAEDQPGLLRTPASAFRFLRSQEWMTFGANRFSRFSTMQDGLQRFPVPLDVPGGESQALPSRELQRESTTDRLVCRAGKRHSSGNTPSVAPTTTVAGGHVPTPTRTHPQTYPPRRESPAGADASGRDEGEVRGGAGDGGVGAGRSPAGAASHILYGPTRLPGPGPRQAV